jgi:hypothetical protein
MDLKEYFEKSTANPKVIREDSAKPLSGMEAAADVRQPSPW